MKLIAAAVLLLPLTTHAVAQSSAPAPSPSAVSTSLTLDSSIEALLADKNARGAVLAVLPDLESAPGFDRFKAISLRRLQPYSGGQITDEHLAKIDAGLKAIAAK